MNYAQTLKKLTPPIASGLGTESANGKHGSYNRLGFQSFDRPYSLNTDNTVPLFARRDSV